MNRIDLQQMFAHRAPVHLDIGHIHWTGDEGKYTHPGDWWMGRFIYPCYVRRPAGWVDQNLSSEPAARSEQGGNWSSCRLSFQGYGTVVITGPECEAAGYPMPRAYAVPDWTVLEQLTGLHCGRPPWAAGMHSADLSEIAARRLTGMLLGLAAACVMTDAHLATPAIELLTSYRMQWDSTNNLPTVRRWDWLDLREIAGY